ncbi:hypothetical protein AB0L59_15870 [Streptomyces sp. NPDC052109]|uniref:hypothetical protein n=1 Tax=Streptomyces sp. NPDC052109 TaxID=3155527 RepID=UPI00343708E4
MRLVRHAAVAAAALALGSSAITTATAAATTPSAGRAAVTPTDVINHSCGPRQDPNKLKASGDNFHTTIGNARIAVRGGRTSSHQWYHWARITGGSVGDTVWLDWADVSGATTPRSWHLCGPYRIRSGHDTHTPAVNSVVTSDMERRFRACGHHAGRTKCTEWL